MQLDSIGQNLRRLRIAKRMRQEDLAERAGLSANYIGMVERGEKIPSLETFIGLLNALDASADIVLADVLNSGYTVKNSLLDEKMKSLSADERATIHDIIDLSLIHI